MKMTSVCQTFAVDLCTARISGSSIPPLTLADPSIDIATAYAIQWEGIRLRLRAGEHIVGAKLGLTSRAKQQEVGFDQPIYSWLTDAMQITGTRLGIDLLRAPRVEPELALVLGRDLDPEDETPASLLEAISAVAPALEVLDSRYPINAPSLPDVIADGASAAAFAIGDPVAWHADEPCLDELRCTLTINDKVIASAHAAEALGGPVRALKALNDAVTTDGRRLTAGSIILTGGLTRAFPIVAGDRITVTFDHPIGNATVTAFRNSRSGA
jgi:2-oxo-3-hexenedioate decarboxylase